METSSTFLSLPPAKSYNYNRLKELSAMTTMVEQADISNDSKTRADFDLVPKGGIVLAAKKNNLE